VSPNTDQARFWGGSGGSAWVDLQRLMDAQLAPLGAAVMGALRLTPGERVLDVGCGCATTTMAIADAVGPSGAVVGVDISEPMIEVGRRAAPSNVSLRVADAQIDSLRADGPFDAAFSRFGVMFFEDPVAAFANIGAAVRADGRLGFVCWQSPRLNEWASGIGALGNEVLGPLEPVAPTAPGPFAFADPDYVHGILGRSGWADVSVADLRPVMQVFGTNDLDVAIDASLRVGGLSRRMASADVTDAQRAALIDKLRGFLSERWTPTGWHCPGVSWLVTARRS
jgi:SAM-dependent methyltransferase